MAFEILFTKLADYFNHSPCGAALETLQTFGAHTDTPFSSYLRAFRVVVASVVEKGGPMTSLSETAMELVRIITAQQYPMLMPTLFPSELATRDRPYDSLASMWTAFANLKHNTTPTTHLPSRPRALMLLHMQPLRLPLYPHYDDVAPGGPLRMTFPLSHLHILDEIPFQYITTCGPSILWLLHGPYRFVLMDSAPHRESSPSRLPTTEQSLCC